MTSSILRAASLATLLAICGCTGTGSPSRSADPTADATDDAKADTIAASKVAPKLAPLLAFLRDDKNLIAQLGPTDTVTEALKKTIKVVSYGEFGRAVDLAGHAVARNYQVAVGSGYRRAYGLVDLVSVGDMYLDIKTGYGDDSFIDKLVVPSRRAEARRLTTALLPEAALISANHASETSTGNYVLVLGDMGSQQAIVMTLEYQVN